MSISLGQDRLTSTTTAHTATRVDATFDAWTVSWAPAWRRFTRSKAIAAMMLAELVAVEHPAQVAAHASELGIDPEEAVRLILGHKDGVNE